MGKNKGKTVGKVAFTVAGFFIGGANFAALGAKSYLGGAIMGASLGGTLWSVASARRNKLKSSGSSIQRFDKAMNTISTTGAIQVVYGTRLVEGNQTYHKPTPELNMLNKHVVLCEGGIQGLMSVMAAGLPIPVVENNYYSNLSAKTFFTISNSVYEDATVAVSRTWNATEGKNVYKMHFYADGVSKEIVLGTLTPSSTPPYSSTHESSYRSDEGEFKALYDALSGAGWGWAVDNWQNLGYNYKLTDIHTFDAVNCYNFAVNIEVNSLKYGSGQSTSSGGTVFTIRNTKHENAKVIVDDHKMFLQHGDDVFKEIKLGEAEDYDNADFAQYELDISSLVSYINRIGEGWSAFPFATTNKLPHDIFDMNEDCYNKYVNVKVECAKGETFYEFHDGDLPENYEEVGGYGGCAWLDLNLTVSDELNGNPNIDVVVQGRKVFDTRTGTTAFSTNPAMCLRDFLLNDRFGVGWTGGLDEESFKEAADFCDEEIEFVDADGILQNRKRYELNLILDQQEDAEDAVSKFLSACCGYLVRYRGVIGMRIEKATSAGYHFTEDQIIKDSFSISQLGLDETPNKYVLNIISPENNWRSTRCIVEDTAMQEATGNIQEESVDLDGVTSQHQALRIGRFYRDLNTVCNKIISFSTASQAMHLQPGDVILVSYYKAIEEMPFRIITMKEEGNGTFTIEGREYCEGIYSDVLGANIHAGKYTTAPPINTYENTSDLLDYATDADIDALFDFDEE